MTTKIEWTDATRFAYLAGVLDSDGFITIHRAERQMAGCTRTGIYHYPQIGIAGTRRQPHDLAAALWGGTVTAYTPKDPTHRVQFQWHLHGHKAVSALEQVRPFLLVKADQAALACSLQALVVDQFAEIKRTQRPPYRVPPAMMEKREDLNRAVKGLNQPRSRGRGYPA
jgi:hypothetical protein